MFVSVVAALIALAQPPATPPAEPYTLGPDSQVQAGVPKGRIEGPYLFRSQVFAGTIRHYWIYVPAQYVPGTPAAVMVFQDGHKYVDIAAEYRVPVVFDNLIHTKQMPVTIGIFVNPGHFGETYPENQWRSNNRSVEYDTPSDRYARFVVDELLPEVGTKYALTSDPDQRAIAGASSGGICAFTVAWERPDAFRKVLSHIGSFTNIRGGHVYPSVIRKSDRKPLRVFLQDGSNDLDNPHGNWPLANQQMAAALKYKGYDHRFEYGVGAHTHVHGGAILPDSLRWLWRKDPSTEPAPQYTLGPDSQVKADVPKGTVTQHTLTTSKVYPGTSRDYWVYVPKQYEAARPASVMVFQDGGGYVREDGSWRVPVVFDNLIHQGAMPVTIGIFINPGVVPPAREGALPRFNRSAEYDDVSDRYARFLVEEVLPEVGKSYNLTTDPSQRAIAGASSGAIAAFAAAWNRPDAFRRVFSTIGTYVGLQRPNGITLSPDQTLLLVADSASQFVYSFQIQPDGSLINKQPFYHLHLVEGAADSAADGITVDRNGTLYVTSRIGLQVADQAGKVNSIVGKPQAGPLSSVVFGGPDFDELFVASGDKIYKRKVRQKGLLNFQEPVTPAPPRL